jgi:hypothetical protein
METHGIYGPVLLATHPSPRGFLSRYLLGLTPVVLAGFSLLVLTYLQNVVATSSPPVVHSLQTIVPELPAYIDMTVLLIAPIGIFLLFIYLGDATNHPEIWIGSSLTILLSFIGAIYLEQGLGIPTVSTVYLLLLFQWTAYLAQPFSIVASALVIIGTEIFRRSIRYTIFRDVIRITGGIWTPIEHLIAYKQISRIIIKQNRFNRFIHIGTILFAGSVFRGTDTSRNGTAGSNGLGGTVSGYTLVSQAGITSPLDCLYGIRDPEKAKQLLEKKIQQP